METEAEYCILLAIKYESSGFVLAAMSRHQPPHTSFSLWANQADRITIMRIEQ